MNEYEEALKAFQDVPSFESSVFERNNRWYQYRSFSSFWPILKSDSFWATDARFSNDTEEQRFGENIMRFRLADAPKEKTMLDEDFIVCFCAEDDKLSQWRGYASEGGVSVGYDFSATVPFCIPLADKGLSNHMKSEDYRQCFAHLGKVCYIDPPEAEYPTEEYYQRCYEAMGAYTGMNKISEEGVEEFLNDLKRRAPFIKHSGFYEESEWRLVFRNENGIFSPCIRYKDADRDGIRRPYIIARPGNPSFNFRRSVVRLCVNESYRERLLAELKRRLKQNPIGDCHYASDYDKNDRFCFGCTRRCWLSVLGGSKCRYKGQNGVFAWGVRNDEQSIIISQGKDQERVFQKVHDCVEEFCKSLPKGNQLPEISVWCEGHLPIRSITIGPCTNQREAEESVAHYCRHVFWLRDVKIKRSNIPFRRAH